MADGVTHAQRCAPGQERDQVPHGRSARGVDSLTFDARGNRLANELSRRDYVTGTTAKTSGDSTDAALEQQLRHTGRCETTGANGPDSAWKPSSCKSSTRPSKSLSRHRDRCRSSRRSGRLSRYHRRSRQTYPLGFNVTVVMRHQVPTTQTPQTQRQVPVIQQVQRTAEVPQVQCGARDRGHPCAADCVGAGC